MGQRLGRGTSGPSRGRGCLRASVHELGCNGAYADQRQAQCPAVAPWSPARGEMSRDRDLHAQRTLVEVEKGVLLLDFRRLLAPDADQLPEHLDIKAGALGLGVDVPDVACQGLALLLKPFDPFDDAAESISGDAAGLGIGSLPIAAGFRLACNVAHRSLLAA